MAIRLGDEAPDFTAETTDGTLTFHDWKSGGWAVLFSHPADFTPVCSTELTEFARKSDEFARMNTKLIGLSIDSIHSHLAWRENLKSILDVEIPYPLIADLSMDVLKSNAMSLYSLFESRYSVRMIRASERLRAISADRLSAELLQVAEGSPLLQVERVAYTYGNKPVEWRRGVYSTQKYHYHNELG